MRMLICLFFYFFMLLFIGCGANSNSKKDEEKNTKVLIDDEENIGIFKKDVEKVTYSVITNTKHYTQYIANQQGGLLRNHPEDEAEPFGTLPYNIRVSVVEHLIDNQTRDTCFSLVHLEKIKGWMKTTDLSPTPVDCLKPYADIYGKQPDSLYLFGPWLQKYKASGGEIYYTYSVFNEDGTYYVRSLSSPCPCDLGLWSFKEGMLRLNGEFNNEFPIKDVTINSFHWWESKFYRIDPLYGPGQLYFVNKEKITIYNKPDLSSEKLLEIKGGADVMRLGIEGDEISFNGTSGKMAKISYNDTIGYVIAAFLSLKQPVDFIFIDEDLFDSYWHFGGEGLVLFENHKWYWSGPGAEDEYGMWSFNESLNILTLGYDSYPTKIQEWEIISLTSQWMTVKGIGSNYDHIHRRDHEIGPFD